MHRQSLGRAVARALAVLLVAGTGAAAQSLPGDRVFTGAGFSIVDNRRTTSRLDIVGSGLVLPTLGDNVTLRLRDVRKPRGSIADWFATLAFVPADGSAPVTTFVFALPLPGDERRLGDLPVTLRFNSGFTGAFIGDPVASGDYRPTGQAAGTDECARTAAQHGSPMSSAFNGRAIDGAWFLTIGDCLSDGGGTVAAWELAFVTRTSTVPEPAATLLLAAGFAATAVVARGRRRTVR